MVDCDTMKGWKGEKLHKTRLEQLAHDFISEIWRLKCKPACCVGVSCPFLGDNPKWPAYLQWGRQTLLLNEAKRLGPGLIRLECHPRFCWAGHWPLRWFRCQYRIRSIQIITVFGGTHDESTRFFLVYSPGRGHYIYYIGSILVQSRVPFFYRRIFIILTVALYA